MNHWGVLAVPRQPVLEGLLSRKAYTHFQFPACWCGAVHLSPWTALEKSTLCMCDHDCWTQQWLPTPAGSQFVLVISSWVSNNIMKSVCRGRASKVFWQQDAYRRVAAAAAKSLQSCQTLCDPIDSSPLGSSVSGILQARTLEWVAISFSNAWKWKVKVKSLSRARFLVTPWTAAYQAPPSMGFSRQEYWSGVPLPSPRRVAKESQCFVTQR